MVEIKHRLTGKVLHRLDSDTLRGCLIRGKELRGANFRNADLSGCHIEGCSLSDADLNSANLTCARFVNCVIQRADMTLSLIHI